MPEASTHGGTYPIQKALVSVYYKEGLDTLCRALARHKVEIYATRGTADYLEKSFGVTCHRIESLTQYPEMMDGRVKTLHPRIFGGVLARRENAQDMDEAVKYEVPLFDLVVVNLYPFAEHLGEPAPEQTKFVDIGGPSLVRAAAKNFSSVAILSDPSDYAGFLDELDRNGGATTRDFRFELAGKAFQRTSAYDAMIAREWAKEGSLPTRLDLAPQEPLRYGENPHQKAAWAGSRAGAWQVLQGKELSFNNLLDAEAALRIVHEMKDTCVAIVKHNNPCGVAAGGASLTDVYKRALACDSRSAFGGIVAVNTTVDDAAANEMSPIFLEVVLAKGFTPGAVEIFSKKKNLRLIAWPNPRVAPVDVRSALGGWLVQTSDDAGDPKRLETVTKTALPAGAEKDVRFAWLVCKHVRSNAIVIARGGATLGIGAGQMSRVDAVGIALEKAKGVAGPEGLRGAVLASDAFFPFRDNIDLLKGTGIAAIVQPGGSQRDQEVIDACNELGIAMAFTGERHFRH